MCAQPDTKPGLLRLLIQAIRGEEQDYTRGGINRAIFLLSVPMVLEMAMESLFAVADVFYVSQLQYNDAVATIGLTESVLTLVYSIAFGVSMGVTAMVARRVGEKQVSDASVAAMQAIYVGVGLSLLIAAGGLLYAEEILTLMGAGPGLLETGSNYTRWMLGGNITIMMIFLINAVFRGAGDASIAMRTLWLANGLNIILDPLFIFGFGSFPAFGVEGAAIATTIGRGIGVIYQVFHLLRGKGLIKIHRDNIAVRWDIIRSLLGLSAGGTGQFVIQSASWIFLVRIVSEFGSAALAGYTIAIRVIIFTILPAWGMANASATLVGQNLGAGAPDRAERSAWRAALFNMIFLGFVGILFLLLAESIISFFTVDPEVLMIGVRCLQIVSLGNVFYAYGMVIMQSFNGAGDTRTPTIINFFGFWLFQIPLAYILATTLQGGPSGAFAAIPIAESVVAVVAILIFRKGKWKEVKV
ncbi:MAG: MATE family efflux transporter [Ignavibacteria bacterium]|nr:MATE family efflux transporter [Ignavibacteria bacterium]